MPLGGSHAQTLPNLPLSSRKTDSALSQGQSRVATHAILPISLPSPSRSTALHQNARQPVNPHYLRRARLLAACLPPSAQSPLPRSQTHAPPSPDGDCAPSPPQTDRAPRLAFILFLLHSRRSLPPSTAFPARSSSASWPQICALASSLRWLAQLAARPAHGRLNIVARDLPPALGYCSSSSWPLLLPTVAASTFPASPQPAPCLATGHSRSCLHPPLRAPLSFNKNFFNVCVVPRRQLS